MKKGLVSIIMPLFNAEKYVEEAILSVINQTIGDWELIIVDDGSTDNSLDIVKKYESENVKIFTQKNNGACFARNRGIEMAQGDLIKFLDADDVLNPDCLELHLDIIKELNENQIPFGDFSFIDASGKLIYEYTFDSEDSLKKDPILFFFGRWEVLISCPLHRRKLLMEINGFDINLPYGQESDLHFRLALHGVDFVYFQKQIFNYRSHFEDSRISKNQKNKTYTVDPVSVYKFNNYESLLIRKYGKLNASFKKIFFKIHFSNSRRFFINGDNQNGKSFLLKAKSYNVKTVFFLYISY